MMVDIVLSDRAYENDIYPLVKAFYPDETVKVYAEEHYMEEFAQAKTNSSCPEPMKLPAHDEASGLYKEQLYLMIKISFLPDMVDITVRDNEGVARSCQLNTCGTETKASFKNSVKRLLYGMLSELKGQTLPWGILTGIRPTKLVYEMLEAGAGEDSIYDRMRKEYLCSDDKTAMSIEIAKRELALLADLDYRDGYSLYIGIPFCPTTCLYCSFTSYPVSKYISMVEDYLAALKKEIEYAAGCFPGKRLSTVYFGGGTPTSLSAEQLDSLLGLVKDSFDFSHVREFCVEAGRPDSITEDKLRVLKKWGVDRISINPQSMQQKTLDIIGRRHTVEDVVNAFRMAREAGHDNINMDIILGLPGENLNDLLDTLEQIRLLDPESLTVHTLAIKRAARLNIEKENYRDMKASDVSLMLDYSIKFARENNYLPYYLYRQKNMADNLENIGYAKYGREGLYNILIMEEKQTILALGAGGMSKFVFHDENRIERVDNVKSITDYIGRIDEMIAKKQNFLEQNRDKLFSSR